MSRVKGRESSVEGRESSVEGCGLVDFSCEEILELDLVPLGICVVGVAHAVCVGGCGGVAIGFAEDEDVALGGIVGQGEYYVVFCEVETLLAA